MKPHYLAKVESLRALDDFHDSFDRAFSIVAFITNRFLVDHMLRAGRLLVENDYIELVIWGVLAHQNVAHLLPPGSMPTAILRRDGYVPDYERRMRPMKLRDVAQITGLPRETVRRKLEQLARRGYVLRTEEGWMVSVERVEPELREFTRESVLRLVTAADEVMRALIDADAEASAPVQRRADE
ncbi:MAG: helix-turn-helix domain-containing protein [Burkholderiales bacterium]|nr:helix-turn-helix domain-containing protein [Burkholderiales bacterium]